MILEKYIQKLKANFVGGYSKLQYPKFLNIFRMFSAALSEFLGMKYKNVRKLGNTYQYFAQNYFIFEFWADFHDLESHDLSDDN